jgi:glucose-1-phosphate thymidylyltransferase
MPAGRATRLGDIPCSRELLPFGFQAASPGSDAHPKPVSQYLVEQMKLASCTHLFFIVRSGRWDIADYYGSGSRFGLDIGYRMMGEPWGPPFTLNLGGATVVLGFPDILIHPCDAIEADAVLATFPARADDCCDLAQATGASGWVGECG